MAFKRLDTVFTNRESADRSTGARALPRWSLRLVTAMLCVHLLFATGGYSRLVAQERAYPVRPITVVVPFGVGGSADRMTRTMSNFIADALGQPVNVINRPGAGTLIGANYFLSRPDDGYSVLASGFSPYLINTVLNGSADYGIEDFAYLNFQWFDEDLIALYRGAPYRNLAELLEAIRTRPKTVRAAVVKGSAGHLTANLLLEANGIPPENLNLVAYNSGGLARAAVAGGVVDFIIISARGCEGIAEYLRPLAVNNDVANETWQVPPLNDLLKPPWHQCTGVAWIHTWLRHISRIQRAISRALQCVTTGAFGSDVQSAVTGYA